MPKFTDFKVVMLLLIAIIITTSLLVVFVLIDIQFLYKVFGYATVIGLIIIVFFTIFSFGMIRKLNNELTEEVDSLLKDSEFDRLENILSTRIKDTFYLNYRKSCEVNLVMVYLLQDKIELAKNILNNSSKATKTICLYYEILLLLDQDKVEEAVVLGNKLFKQDEKTFKVQKDNCHKLLKIVIEKEYKEEYKMETNFPIVKRIINKYTTN